MKKSRSSNYELMRIISMIYIVIYHFMIHTNACENSTGLLKLFFIVLESIIIVHVNSFILVTGYFQCENKFKLKKVIKIINQTWFYKVTIMFSLVIIGTIALPDTLNLFRVLFPIDNNTYWYVTSYLLIYLISPILNIIIKNTNKKQLQYIVLLLFTIISVISTISKDVIFNSYTGRSLSTFILLYFIGSYLRKYPLDKEKILKNIEIKKKKYIALSLYFIFAIISTLFYVIYLKLFSKGYIIGDVVRTLGFAHISYASPIVVLQTIAYFMFFGYLNIHSNFINKISSATLGVYLITENIYVRENLYNYYNFNNVYNISVKFTLNMLVICLIVFIVCAIIEIARQEIFKIINKLKFIKKIDEKLDKIHFAIN